MSYLVGAGLTLVVLLGCLPLLNHSGETPPDPSDAPTTPSATQETEVIAHTTRAGLSSHSAGTPGAESGDL